MDVSHGMPHGFVMEPPKRRGGNERPLLSVVVDDDESVRESLPDLETSCLLLDIAMPGMTGPELQQDLKRRGQEIPIIFITGRTDDTVRTRVLKQGAAGFLLKPFSDSDLLAAIKVALHRT